MYNGAAPERAPTSPSLQSPRNAYRPMNLNPPATFQFPSRGQPTSPSSTTTSAVNGFGRPPRDKTPSTYFDPTAEHRERRPSWTSPSYPVRSPTTDQHPYTYKTPRPEHRSLDREHTSPVSSHRTHHSPVYARSPLPHHQESTEHFPQSPGGRNVYNNQSMASRPSSTVVAERQPSTVGVSSNVTQRRSTSNAEYPAQAPHRVTDPMSFSSILSADSGPTTRISLSPRAPRKPSRPTDDFQPPLGEEAPSFPSSTTRVSMNRNGETQTHDEVDMNDAPKHTAGLLLKLSEDKPRSIARTPSIDKVKPNGETESSRHVAARANKPKPVILERDYQAALSKIDATDFSDLEAPGFEIQKENYASRIAKRVKLVEEHDLVKRKRRRIAQTAKFAEIFGRQALMAKERYFESHEQAAYQQIQSQDLREEKEHKKVMQRNRRRETQKQKAEQQAAELKRKAQETDDRAEKEKLFQQAHRAEKKATATSRLLNGETPSKEIREITPLAPNMEGGIMSSFQMGDEAPQEPPKKKPRLGGRLKKSKEQKQAEKDAAAAAHAAMERGEDLISIAPKVDSGRQPAKREATVVRDATPAERAPVASKAYEQLYEQIWRDIARKDIPKLYRMKDNSLSTKQSNLRKTAQLASKEARRWQLKTNKSTKDTQARAKRVMREMLSFWKRNEREERDQRKMAERQELENAKKAEADREANRQKRKLNFLISQTELYSHFIGKKVKTDEVERSTDDVDVSNQTIKPAPSGSHTIILPESVAKIGTKVTNFEDLDFDAEDETALREAAMANAQNAVQEAQDRARAFNNEGQLQSQFDDGEMNFQNPTSLQSMDIAQPAMLTCQLKEYQLKGLNWLVNLYEQGINGILADEMGLGKTVQSISVMAYLAEFHNIWGPFLVIAPASTLHNWQQEIVRFVPSLKVLPYWGNAKDRKVLRKFWDRKHITYTKDSPFHVLVTSYQLVVHDTQYFQKIRWQYMILDEAQAIKSSQSSRWKALLGFHCRNRLLLTGTPIQNNMQELWALLHFIMPSLFDSHDEFSDWFSKDIESHAQSNTKLNEDQLKRLHMILKPFMLRRIKKHVQKELGDKIELDVFCDLTYRQRAYYTNLRNKISLLDLIEKAAVGDDQDTATLMNLVMQFRKVCNHPDLFERADTTSPVSFSYFAETASFLREGHNVEVGYSVRNLIEYRLPRLIARNSGRIDLPGPDNEKAGSRNQLLQHTLSVWSPENILRTSKDSGLFSWLRFIDASAGEVSSLAYRDVFQRAVDLLTKPWAAAADVSDDDGKFQFVTPTHALFNVVHNKTAARRAASMGTGYLHDLMNVSSSVFVQQGLNAVEPCARPAVSAPPIELYCASQGVIFERQQTFFSLPMRSALYGISEKTELAMLDSKVDPKWFPVNNMLPAPISEKARYTKIEVPSMRRFVTDSGKLGKLDQLLAQLKEGNHRVLLYFQMTRMIDLMEEYLTYRNYKYCRLDGSTKLEDRRDTVADFQSRSDIFIFLLSTRAGGLGINLTAADTVIFYDSDWNPTIDSQAMDRAHRLGQTRQVTVYRMITRGTIEERIRKRALQKEEVQRVVISGGAGAHVDFNTRSRENRTKDIAMWLADDDQAAEIEKKEQEIAEKEAKEPTGGRKKRAPTGKRKTDVTLDDMYHEGEGHFDDSSKPSGAATPIAAEAPTKSKRKGISKKAKTIKEKLAIADGGV